jgi:hypothetical protein
MITIVIRRVYLHPATSPSRPEKTVSKGRTAKPAANASNAKMNAVVSLTPRLMMAASDP